jgi:hypothetical protein
MIKQPALWQRLAQRLADLGRPEPADDRRVALLQSSRYASHKRLSKKYTVDEQPLDGAISVGRRDCLDEER